MKFLVDMPLSPALADWLVERGHDAVHALSVGLERAPDESILERAERDQRVVITADLDYPRLLAMAEAKGPGLILFRGGNWSERAAIIRLAKALETIAERELANSIVVVESRRIRMRRLPVQRKPGN